MHEKGTYIQEISKILVYTVVAMIFPNVTEIQSSAVDSDLCAL